MDKIETIMKNLKCSRAEALALMADDKAVDQNKPMPFDLPPDKAKTARQYAHCGTRKVTETKSKKKENATKVAIINQIYGFLTENGYEKCEIANKDREITFYIGDISYSVTLIEHRKAKN